VSHKKRFDSRRYLLAAVNVNFYRTVVVLMHDRFFAITGIV
jgi:hypothetical protein